ncbi:hypothetical protein PIB30_091355 [Stylosanthes scabra]|uniref:Putative plant transposon protein domain-containing protein n=1 Tax=Stylosanthes scabra TaxID=79078 RepID=A0ABU6SV68_9FABA|nr:hypothetical protein [Stylosanthes scabra]
MASSSSVSVFDNHRFKSAFNEELYNSIVKNKKIIAECCINLNDDEYPEVKEQLSLRGWRRLAAPKQEISIDLIHEFYANAILTEEEMEEAGGHTFKSYVRGKVVDFSPENLRNVMRFREQVQGAATDFETRKEHDQQLDQVLADLCIPGATWKLSTGQMRVPIQLRRQELNPVARGWHEFSIHSLIPSSNRSEIPVIRAILIHCIMRGEDVRAENIIADKIVRMAQGIMEKGKLGFPSTIYKLCKEAEVPLREFRRTRKIQEEKPITARRMESTRLPRPIQPRQQEGEDEDHPMPQAEEGNEEENEGQAHDYDYHNQPDHEHYQPDYEQHHEFNEPPVQPPLHNDPTYTDQHQKDLESIECQLQNMMWYQQQALENMSKNQAEYMTELRDIKGKQQQLYDNNDRFYNQVKQEQKEMLQEIQQIKNYQVNQTLVESTRHKAYLDELAAMKARQEEFFANQATQYNMLRQDQKLLGKEILDVKKYQMSAVTMASGGSSSSQQPEQQPEALRYGGYDPDQALMKIREQHATFTEICRQLKDWTRNASGRESYMVWAHQLANPNLVEMSSQKVVKQIYDNIDRRRPMFRGLLKSDLQPPTSAPQPSDPTQPLHHPRTPKTLHHHPKTQRTILNRSFSS